MAVKRQGIRTRRNATFLTNPLCHINLRHENCLEYYSDRAARDRLISRVLGVFWLDSLEWEKGQLLSSCQEKWQ